MKNKNILGDYTNNIMKKQEKIVEYNIVRVLAVTFVLISHCMYYKIITNYGGINYNEIGLVNLTKLDIITRKVLTLFSNILYTFHMPLFFMLSGAILKNSINKGKISNFKELIIKKTKRLLIPFIIITLLFSVPLKYVLGYFGSGNNLVKDIFVGQILLQGNNYLWFLPILFANFCITWIIQAKVYTKSGKMGTILFLTVLNLCNPLIEIEFLKRICWYLIYFYIGYCFEEYRTKINDKTNQKKFRNICFEILCIIISLIVFNVYHFKWKILKSIFELIMGILGAYMVYLISYKLSKTKISQSYMVKKINEYSFGLYLYSDPWNYLILYFGYNIFGIRVFYTNPGIILIFIVRFIITFSVAWFITAFLRKKKVKYIC